MKETSLSQKVYSALRDKILSNQLLPGTRLKEDQWAKKLEVNRIAVREALNRLYGENLLKKGEKGGYYVKSMEAGDIHELRELREVLELGALRLAIQKITAAHIEEMNKICDDFTSMYKNGYYGGACEADVRFHEMFFNIIGNEKLKNVYISSNIPIFHLKLGQSSAYMNDFELTDKEHRAILNALIKKDLPEAETLLVKHLLRGEVSATEIE
ncbi:GntR family transcriptional regulator [Niabella aurantiaca]|uniref:GntR family transcriptional regulator n=1 Tax=Niabella aurantiaca TaxID=379900 RepID=UPI0003759D97|nr:GntR family transcriptional regulator [Niabella aurantiaca]